MPRCRQRETEAVLDAYNCCLGQTWEAQIGSWENMETSWRQQVRLGKYRLKISWKDNSAIPWLQLRDTEMILWAIVVEN